MSEKEKQIIETFALIIPKLSESDKSYLLGLGEGMAIKVELQEKKIDTLEIESLPTSKDLKMEEIQFTNQMTIHDMLGY